MLRHEHYRPWWPFQPNVIATVLYIECSCAACCKCVIDCAICPRSILCLMWCTKVALLYYCILCKYKCYWSCYVVDCVAFFVIWNCDVVKFTVNKYSNLIFFLHVCLYDIVSLLCVMEYIYIVLLYICSMFICWIKTTLSFFSALGDAKYNDRLPTKLTSSAVNGSIRENEKIFMVLIFHRNEMLSRLAFDSTHCWMCEWEFQPISRGTDSTDHISELHSLSFNTFSTAI